MRPIYIIAEAAQGYEGSVDIARLLVRAAKAGGADGIKFQVIYASDLCEPGYRYYELFSKLELRKEDWARVRTDAAQAGLDFLVDVFGSKSLAVAADLNVDAIKLHSTTFYDDRLTRETLELNVPTFISIGGVEISDVDQFMQRHEIGRRKNVTLMFGFQSEPTPTAANNLNRIASLRGRYGIDVGFMDHSDGAGPHEVALSAMALGLGVTKLEKHITLDRELELEDFVSGLPPKEFRKYSDGLRELSQALGTGSLALTPEETGYKERALKRVVAARDIASGSIVEPSDVRLSRPALQAGIFDPKHAIGRRLLRSLTEGTPIEERDIN